MSTIRVSPRRLLLVLSSLLIAYHPAQALTETVLYSFTGVSDGKIPSGLLADASGTLYGTTQTGGASGFGTVFSLPPSGQMTVLHDFRGGADGAAPSLRASLIRDSAGNLYGTTILGGASNHGTVFEITAGGSEKILYSFTGPTDGANPQAGLVQDAKGNFYGTTLAGGAFGAGTVFKLTQAGKEQVLYSFTGGADGAAPVAPLVLDALGNLYGSASLGGGFYKHCPQRGCGVIFKITPAGTEKVLWQFLKFDYGVSPQAPVLLDANGNVFGTTFTGGPSGYGLLFMITPAGQQVWLHYFRDHNLTGDGGYPIGPFVQDAKGNFYGVTYKGGTHNQGTVFMCTPNHVETVLYNFTGASDGGLPQSGLAADAQGNYYGTTLSGGAFGKGTIFKLTAQKLTTQKLTTQNHHPMSARVLR